MFFALAHGTQDGWLFGDRLAFGVVASWLAWRTGGLEAPIALHVANNLVSLAVTASTGSLEDSLTASTLEWQFAATDVAMMLTFAVVVERLVRRRPVDVRRSEGPAAAVRGRPRRGARRFVRPRTVSAILVRARPPRRQRGATTLGVWGNWQPG